MQEADLAYNTRRLSNGGIDGGDLHAELSAGAHSACCTRLFAMSDALKACPFQREQVLAGCNLGSLHRKGHYGWRACVRA